jgi:hypothetical protein
MIVSPVAPFGPNAAALTVTPAPVLSDVSKNVRLVQSDSAMLAPSDLVSGYKAFWSAMGSVFDRG